MTEERIAQLEQMLERGTICKGHIAEMLGAIKQRTWAGLTDEEKKDLCRWWSSPMDAIYATEAKLKERNA